MVQYADYDKIVDTVMFLNNGYILKFYVDLYRKNSKRGRVPFHGEIGYDNGDGFRVNINRDFNFYLSIESIMRSDIGEKVQVRIYQNDMYFLIEKLKQVMLWFTDKKFNKLFVKHNGKIIMPDRPESIIVNVSFDRYIEFEPGVSMFAGEEITGVKVYLSNDNAGFFLTTRDLFAFYYVISNFNMFLSAQSMLAYFGKPEMGVNYFGINGAGETEQIHRSPINLSFNTPVSQNDLYTSSNMKMHSNIRKTTSFLEFTGGTEKKKDDD